MKNETKEPGITTREGLQQPYHPSRLDYFTAAALTGILSNLDNTTSLNIIADDAVSAAKAVIEELDKTI